MLPQRDSRMAFSAMLGAPDIAQGANREALEIREALRLADRLEELGELTARERRQVERIFRS